MPVQIQSYVLSWHPGANRGGVLLTLVDGNQVRIPVEDPAELTALATILNESPAYAFENGAVGTGIEPVE